MATMTYQTHYEYELKKLIEQEIQRLTEVVTQENGAVIDYDTYRYHIGQIRGLRTALMLCDEVDAVINGEK
jgi:hypothetical protein